MITENRIFEKNEQFPGEEISVEGNLGLVRLCASRFRGKGIEYEENYKVLQTAWVEICIVRHSNHISGMADRRSDFSNSRIYFGRLRFSHLNNHPYSLLY